MTLGKKAPGTSCHKERDHGGQQREPAVAGDEAVGQDGDEPLPGGVDDPAAGDSGGVAAQPHGHGQALLAAGAALFKGAVHIEGDSGKIAGILQKSKKRKEDRHRRQHHGDDPGRYPVNAIDQDAGQPPGGVEGFGGS